MTDKNLVLAISSQERRRILAREYLEKPNELATITEFWRKKKQL